MARRQVPPPDPTPTIPPLDPTTGDNTVSVFEELAKLLELLQSGGVSPVLDGGGVAVHPVQNTFFKFNAAAPNSETIRWTPGEILMAGFYFYTTGGISFCISLDGTIAADTVSAGAVKPGLIWKNVSTQAGTYLFPTDGITVHSTDTVYLSKNQASTPEFGIFWRPV